MPAWLLSLPKPVIWILVGLAILLLCVVQQWARAGRIIKQTKADLAQRTAERDAAAASAKRTETLQEETAKLRQDLDAKLAAVEAKRRADLGEIALKADETRAGAKDASRVIEEARRQRKEGKIP